MKSGIINVYKEAGFTSFDVCAKLRGVLSIKKIGHTGTLDPDATGVLPVCIGKATKVCSLLTDKDKVYKAVMLLGTSTDTYDISGKVLEEKSVDVSEEDIKRALLSFVGEIDQVPPMYSAIKVNGKKLYQLAREGKEIERQSRRVEIYSIDDIDIDLPRVSFSVHCSKGTYIRSLCYDVGQQLNCGACLESLVRTKVSIFSIEEAYTISQIEELKETNQLDSIIISVDDLFLELEKIYVLDSASSIKKCLNGALLSIEDLIDFDNIIQDQRYRVYLPDGRFVGIYYGKDSNIKLEKMFFEE